MKTVFPLAAVLLAITCVNSQLDNLLNTDFHRCIECLCHARTGCFSRITCASYSISYDYWTKADSPRLNSNDPVNENSYEACMKDENCILNTIKLYTNGYGEPNCTCDSIYDCRDMLMIHLHGDKCTQDVSSIYRSRYNDCAKRNNLSTIDSVNRCT